MSSDKSKRKILYLRAALILALSIIWGYALYIALFVPTTKEFYPLDISSLQVGEWSQLLPFETFISGPEQLKTTIIKDPSGKKFIRIKAVNSAGTYSGIIFHIKKPVPKNTGLELHWRSSGHAPMILIDVMDGSKIEENQRDIGENFDLEYPVPDSIWGCARFSLDTLELNSYQPAGKKLDGIFNYNQIRRVSITFYPKSDIALDISDLHFYWKTEKWATVSVLFFTGLIGLLLLFRAKPENLILKGGTSLHTNVLISRTAFCLAGLSVSAAVFLRGPDILCAATLSTYAALLILILVEEFTALFQQNPIWSLRYAIVLFAGYFMDFSGGILSMSLILMAAYVPIILEKMRVLFWATALLALLGYIAAPQQDYHFTFLTGLILILCCSVIAVVFREILQQQQADFIAEKAILQYEALFRGTSDAIFWIDENGKIETINNRFERLTGYSQNEIKGCLITDLICRESKETMNEMLRNIEQNDSGQYDIHFAHKNGETRTALVRGSAIFRNKELAGYQALATDITERKIAEEKLKQTAELLDNTASELAGLNEQLSSSEQQLRELNAGKDKFLSIISHDLKSPFSSLLGFSDLIVNEYENLSDEEIKMFSANINGSIRSIYKLLDNLLQWATIQRGKMEYKPGVINLHEQVEGTIGILTSGAVKKNIRICNDTEKDVQIYADFNSVNSVIQNLVMNSIKFTHSGGEIRVSSKRTGKVVEITVSDSGIGMTKEEQEKLFRIDVQHTTHGTAKEKGTGLGLILCKEMLEHNGGTIRVESEPGKGSRFIFTLPEFITVNVNSEVIS